MQCYTLLTVFLAFHKSYGIFCNSSRSEVKAVSWKIVIYFQSSSGGAIIRRWLKKPFWLKNKKKCLLPVKNLNKTSQLRHLHPILRILNLLIIKIGGTGRWGVEKYIYQ